MYRGGGKGNLEQDLRPILEFLRCISPGEFLWYDDGIAGHQFHAEQFLVIAPAQGTAVRPNHEKILCITVVRQSSR